MGFGDTGEWACDGGNRHVPRRCEAFLGQSRFRPSGQTAHPGGADSQSANSPALALHSVFLPLEGLLAQFRCCIWTPCPPGTMWYFGLAAHSHRWQLQYLAISAETCGLSLEEQ